MKLIICLEEKCGYSFAGKRLSRDRVVIERIRAIGREDGITVSPYSSTLFESGEVRVEDNIKESLSGYYFAETEIPDIEYDEIIIFHWNRAYPADKFYSVPKGYNLEESTDFSGYSHDKITLERWIKK